MYVGNNPVNYIDPTGHNREGAFLDPYGFGGGPGGGGALGSSIITNGVDWAGLGFSVNDFIASPGFGTAAWVLWDALMAVVPLTQNTTAAARLAAKELSSSEFLKGFRGVKAFTANNARQNLIKLTGFTGKGHQAHHVFPQQFTQLKDILEAAGISVHDPRYLVWWETTDHLKNASAYNAEWAKFLLEKNPTAEEVLEKGRELMTQFGKQVGY